MVHRQVGGANPVAERVSNVVNSLDHSVSVNVAVGATHNAVGSLHLLLGRVDISVAVAVLANVVLAVILGAQGSSLHDRSNLNHGSRLDNRGNNWGSFNVNDSFGGTKISPGLRDRERSSRLNVSSGSNFSRIGSTGSSSSFGSRGISGGMLSLGSSNRWSVNRGNKGSSNMNNGSSSLDMSSSMRCCLDNRSSSFNMSSGSKFSRIGSTGSSSSSSSRGISGGMLSLSGSNSWGVSRGASQMDGKVGGSNLEAPFVGNVLYGLNNTVTIHVVVGATHNAVRSLGLLALRAGRGVAKAVLAQLVLGMVLRGGDFNHRSSPLNNWSSSLDNWSNNPNNRSGC